MSTRHTANTDNPGYWLCGELIAPTPYDSKGAESACYYCGLPKQTAAHSITLERHAAHTGNGTGWDLERIDAIAERREDVRDIPAGFTYHSGYRGLNGDGVGYQVWIYYRHAPLSPGTCDRCK